MHLGTIVDATLIAAPSSTKNKERKPVVIRDEGPYGRGQGFRPDPSVAVTAVNVHDLTPAADLLHDDEQVVYGYTG